MSELIKKLYCPICKKETKCKFYKTWEDDNGKPLFDIYNCLKCGDSIGTNEILDVTKNYKKRVEDYLKNE